MIEITIHVTGVEDVQGKLSQVDRDLSGAEMRKGMMDACLIVQRAAQMNAPVDRGELKSSITSQVRSRDDVIEGVVGSNVFYAPYMELGTGTFVGKKKHRPPAAALELWAKRHGCPSGWWVAWRIWLRGGLEPRKFLEKAFKDNIDRIEDLVGAVVAKIVAR